MSNEQREDSKIMTPSTTTSRSRPSSLRVWIIASRPHTLTASLSPCLVAYGWLSSKFQNYNYNYLMYLWTMFCI